MQSLQKSPRSSFSKQEKFGAKRKFNFKVRWFWFQFTLFKSHIYHSNKCNCKLWLWILNVLGKMKMGFWIHSIHKFIPNLFKMSLLWNWIVLLFWIFPLKVRQTLCLGIYVDTFQNVKGCLKVKKKVFAVRKTVKKPFTTCFSISIFNCVRDAAKTICSENEIDFLFRYRDRAIFYLRTDLKKLVPIS